MSGGDLPNLNELEAKARAADEMSAVPDDWYRVSLLERLFHSREEAEFVAAASPSSVLALIARVRELEDAVTETRRLLLGRAHYFEEGRGEFTKVSLDEIHAVLKGVGAPL